jgi:deoxyribodipyrimidine photo-lyase
MVGRRSTTSVAVFTRDLRVRDNPSLAAAARSERIVPLFVLDPRVGSGWHRSPHRFGFLCESLTDLDSSLRSLGGGLVVRQGEWVDEVMKVVHDTGATAVHMARDVSGYAQRRHEQLHRAAASQRVEVVQHDSLSVVPADAFGKPYQVFTPYWRRWLATPVRGPARPVRGLRVHDGLGSVPIPRHTPPAPWEGGEAAGRARAKAWTSRRVARYGEDRERPDRDGTARLSPYLHFGCLSPVELARRYRAQRDSEAWLRQLCWRDFFMQLLWWKPELAYHDLRAGVTGWVNDPDEIDAWKQGRTGFPLVDAGMRQLRDEGWVHNRVRMVVASFLTKDLQVDWRVGAAHFMELLVDGDVAVNQLSWQWVAGTGTGANPHRVLDPSVQARKHDPDGRYVRRWIEELDTARYPAPIVDHHQAIGAWRASRSS